MDCRLFIQESENSISNLTKLVHSDIAEADLCPVAKTVTKKDEFFGRGRLERHKARTGRSRRSGNSGMGKARISVAN